MIILPAWLALGYFGTLPLRVHTAYVMFGFNWIDLIIILILAGTLLRGMRIGAAVELGTAGGFFAGLFLAGWLLPHLLPIHDRTLRTLVNGNLVLITAALAAIQGYKLGHRIHLSLGPGRWHKLETDFGAISAVSAVIVIWLLAATIGRLPFAGLSNSVNDSLIVQALDRRLPSVPAVLAVFNRQIDPNSPPKLLITPPRPYDTFAFSAADFQAATAKSAASVVRITGFGCGDIIGGTGFAIARDLVVTNAHVVAGVERPIIKYGNQSYAAVPVLFDPSLDFAALELLDPMQTFRAPPLVLATNAITAGTTVATIGYPDGYYAAVPGIVRSDFTIAGRTIYGLGVVSRDAYGVQTKVDNGSSGSPIVLADGRVAGVIFANDKSVDDYAYALTSSSLSDSIQKAEKAHQRISTGACLAD